MQDCFWKITLGCIIVSLISCLIFSVKVVLDILKNIITSRMAMYPL